MKNSNYYAILMAGGVGSRFWPVSTTDFPKQFHDMLGTGETLLQRTFYRLSNLIPQENIFILTNERYNDLVKQQLPQITSEQIVLEPDMRNTAPCILYASLKIQKINSEALILVAPSDHWIENEQAFNTNIQQAFDFCTSSNALLTLGIIPTHPNTGYGYIEYEKNDTQPIKKVTQFREKPDFQTAQEFVKKGNFLWNAGIFIWSAQSIIDAFQSHQTDMYQLLANGIATYNTPLEEQFIKQNYGLASNISIDYAVLEKSDNVYVLPATFDWNDLGTWGSLYEKLDKDANDNAVINSKTLLENASGNIIRTNSEKRVIIQGLDNYIIVDKDDVLLIWPKNQEQDIKRITTLANEL